MVFKMFYDEYIVGIVGCDLLQLLQQLQQFITSCRNKIILIIVFYYTVHKPVWISPEPNRRSAIHRL